MKICYSSRSYPTAQLLAELTGAELVLGGEADINWGRSGTNATLNRDTSNTTNKRVMRELFKEHNVPMPKLLSVDEICELFVTGGAGDFVGRPDVHMKGRGFWRVNSTHSLNRALLGTRLKKPATHFMEYIDAPREYRVHIFGGKSIRISEKLFGLTGSTNRGDYITGKPQHNIKHVRKAAKQAIAAVGLDFGAVDVLANDTECWVLEVNSAPSLGGSLPELYARKFLEWYDGR